MFSSEKNESFLKPTLPHSELDRNSFLKSLPKTSLLDRIQALAAEERRIGVELLWHLREVDRRRLAEELGFSGIFDYCVKVLRFSEGSAHRRVQAMRALKGSPEIAEALKDGRLNVTTASQIQTFIQRSKKAGLSEETIRSRLIRLEITSATDPISPPSRATEGSARAAEGNFFSSFEKLSSREVERKLSDLAPELPRVERERAISESEVEIRVTLSTSTRTKWTRIQQLAAHRLRFDTSTRKLIELTTDMTLDTLEKEKGLRPKPEIARENSISVPPKAPIETQTQDTPAPIPPSTRFIPTAVRRTVWRRDNGICSYHDLETGRRCESRFGLEIDHIKPWSLGGSSLDPENLRLLCAAHHRMLTARTFGARPAH